MTRLFRCVVLCGAVSLTLGATRETTAQENPAAEASRRLQLRSDQLAALYFEAASIHNGFVHTIDVARFGDCSQAEKVASDLDAPPNRFKALRQVTKTSRYANRFLFAMEPELREQVRSMNEKDRTGVIKLASGECLLSEVVEYQQRPMPEPKELGPMLALMVDRGWLPHPDLLEQDPKLRSRTVVNRVRSVADVEALPAEFDINTRRSDGYTILTRALLLNQLDVVQAALKRSADPNLCGPRFCPIELALRLGDAEQAREMLDLLLQAGADANQFDRGQRTRMVPLAIAVGKDLGVVARLIKAGARPNGIPEASPPLFFAAASGKREAVEYLISQGADLFARDISRPGVPNTLYTAARETKNPLFVEWIEQRMLEAAAKSGKYKCELWLEQDGRRIQASGGEYRLKRAPFRIVVRLAEPGTGGVMVASGETPAFHNDVRENTHESAIFRPASTVAEESEGKSDWLDVLPAASSTKESALQYWSGERVQRRRHLRRCSCPVELSLFDQRFIDPILLKLTFPAAR